MNGKRDQSGWLLAACKLFFEFAYWGPDLRYGTIYSYGMVTSADVLASSIWPLLQQLELNGNSLHDPLMNSLVHGNWPYAYLQELDFNANRFEKENVKHMSLMDGVWLSLSQVDALAKIIVSNLSSTVICSYIDNSGHTFNPRGTIIGTLLLLGSLLLCILYGAERYLESCNTKRR